MSRSDTRRPVFTRMHLAALAGAFVAALVVSIAQHLMTGGVSPMVTGGVAGGVSAAIYFTLRRKTGS